MVEADDNTKLAEQKKNEGNEALKAGKVDDAI